MQQIDQPTNTNEEMQPAQENAQANKGTSRILLAVIASVLLTVSGFMLYSSIGSYIRGIAAQSYKMGDGTVSRVEERFDAFGVSKEAHVQFKVDGVDHEAPVAVPEHRVLKKGELTAVFYDPNNPQNIVLSQEIDYDPITVYGAFGLFIFCFGALMAYKALPRR